jgi:predicted transposase YbfD/YdcC
MCGYRSYSAIAEWGRNYGPVLAKALGFKDSLPCASTLHYVFRRLQWDKLEEQLALWAEGIMGSPKPGEVEAVAIDGKTLRGSRKQGAHAAHIISAVGHRLGITIGQVAVDDKTNEIGVVLELLALLLLEGRVFTLDAMLTQREVAQTIVAGGGDYLMTVKGNQPQLQADIKTVFSEPEQVLDTMSSAESRDIGHGRIEHRHLTASTALVGYSDWPGLQQVLRLERSTTLKRTGQKRHEVVYGVTSLTVQEADPQRLLLLSRHHWSIENKSHWVRDVTLDEDRSQVRCDQIPQVMASLRNAAISLMRSSPESNIAALCRRFAAQPTAALALLGVITNFE